MVLVRWFLRIEVFLCDSKTRNYLCSLSMQLAARIDGEVRRLVESERSVPTYLIGLRENRVCPCPAKGVCGTRDITSARN